MRNVFRNKWFILFIVFVFINVYASSNFKLLDVDFIRLDNSTVSTLGNNADITFDPHGTGLIRMASSVTNAPNSATLNLEVPGDGVVTIDGLLEVSRGSGANTSTGYLKNPLSSGGNLEFQAGNNGQNNLSLKGFPTYVLGNTTGQLQIGNGVSQYLLLESGSSGAYLSAGSGSSTINFISPLLAQTTVQLDNQTASRAVVTNGSKQLVTSSVTSTELGYVSGVTSAIQTQINNIINNQLKVNMANIECDASSVIFNQQGFGGSWIQNITNVGGSTTNTCTITFNSTAFTVKPACVVTPYENANTNLFIFNSYAATSTHFIEIRGIVADTSGSDNDWEAALICVGI